MVYNSCVQTGKCCLNLPCLGKHGTHLWTLDAVLGRAGSSRLLLRLAVIHINLTLGMYWPSRLDSVDEGYRLGDRYACSIYGTTTKWRLRVLLTEQSWLLPDTSLQM